MEVTRERVAKVAARTAAWLRSDETAVQQGFRAAGIDVYEHRPAHHYVHDVYGHSAAKLASPLDDDAFVRLADAARDDHRTYLYYDRLHTLYGVVRDVARRFPGSGLSVLEVGVYRGGSTRFLADSLEAHAPGLGRVCAVDTFSGHDPADLPEGREGAHTVEKFRRTSHAEVVAYLRDRPSVAVVQGRIQDLAAVVDDRLHIIHADVDILIPTRFVLGLAVDRLVVGGVVVVDDYGFVTCPGTRQAVAEFLERHGQAFASVALPTGQAVLIRMC